MARFIKLALTVHRAALARGTKVPFHFIANDGNLVVNPIKLTELDEQAVGERYDIVVDFSTFKPGDSIRLTNLVKQTDGRRPDKIYTVEKALKGDDEDPCVGPILEFRVVGQVQSVDDPSTNPQLLTTANACGINDKSTNFADFGLGVRRQDADGADPDRGAGPHPRVRIWAFRRRRLARPRRSMHPRLSGGHALPMVDQN